MTPSSAESGNQPKRLGPHWLNLARALVGTPSKRRLARAALRIDQVRHWESHSIACDDSVLASASMRLRGRARGGEPLYRLVPEAFGLACVACQRAIHLRPFDVQIAAAIVLQEGAIAELATGEGKTLVGILPVYLHALLGKGAHVVTVNEYLAQRDGAWTAPVFSLLGLSTGILRPQMNDPERAAAYRCDITFGTAGDFGFDFLRDRLRARGAASGVATFHQRWYGEVESTADEAAMSVQRGHHFALVDEADSIFIDEARTPLIIATPTRLATTSEQQVFHWANEVAQGLTPHEHFQLDERTKCMELTERGRQVVRWSRPPSGPSSHGLDKLYEHVERAAHVLHRSRRDQHYLVADGKVVIIDEYSGRVQPDRHWQEGLHQAVEAKEGVPISADSDKAAQVTLQSYFRLYRHLTGMTGTAAQNRRELRRVYKLRVVCVPTNRPVCRTQWPDIIVPTLEAKFDQVLRSIAALTHGGRPVLVGTRSVEMSELLSKQLHMAGIDHQVLNARHHLEEAAIVAKAGQRGQVTIATNMAGRGTDIKLGPGIAELGGLHVIGTERHEAGRVDRQLAGRSGRQGDPGSCQFILSLEDELLESLGLAQREGLQHLGQAGEYKSWQQFGGLFRRAQRTHERRHRQQRVDLMLHEKQRHEILKDLNLDPYID